MAHWPSHARRRVAFESVGGATGATAPAEDRAGVTACETPSTRAQGANSIRRAARSGGFTYVWLLVAVAIMAAGLAAIGEVASTAAKREKEAELLFVGDQFARAIAEFHASSPGAPQYPQKLEDLLRDSRYPNTRRYLRRVYPDPMTGRADWGLERGPGGGIVGVHSQSLERPLKTANFPRGYEAFAGATTYAAWRFAPATAGSRIAPGDRPGQARKPATGGASPGSSGSSAAPR